MAEFTSWRDYWHFAQEVTRHRRYVLTEESRKFLQTVQNTCAPRIRSIPGGSVFWRAQLGHDWRFEEQIQDELPAAFDPDRMRPLSDRAFEGRVNPKGIPCLYVATDKNTALAEVRPGVGSLISVAQFKTERAANIIDFSVNPKSFIFFLEEPDAAEREQAVWSEIDRAFAEPVARTDDNANYAPTQVIAETFRAMGFDGVAFRSSLGQGLNIAFFDLNICRLRNCQLCKTSSVSYEFKDEDNPYFVRD